jgi:hypothetical protein
MDWFERLTGFQESLLSADVLALLLQLMWQQSCDVSVDKVEMSLGGIAGSVSRRRGEHHIGAAPASAGSFRLRFGGFGDLQGAVL